MVRLARHTGRAEGDYCDCPDWKRQPGRREAVGHGVSERRITFGPGYRLYFGQDGQKLVVLLTGGVKKRQSKDIEQAQECWADYKKRRNGG